MSAAATELPPNYKLIVSPLMAGTKVVVRKGDTITCGAGTAFRLEMGENVACIDLTEFEKGIFDLPMTTELDK